MSEPRTAAGRVLLAQAGLMHKRWPVTDGLIGRHDILAIEAEAATPAPLLCLMPDFDGDDCRFWAKTYGQEPCANCAKRYDLAATPAPLDVSDCGAIHPEHPGTHCRRKPGHGGEHATARYDVTWDNAYLSAPEGK